MKTLLIGATTLVLGVGLGAAAMAWQANRTTKANTETTLAAVPSLAPSATTPDNQWDPFSAMRQMQANMDQMFRSSIDRFHQEPMMQAFNDKPGYSLALDVRDLKDHIEVHATLPDAKASDVNVQVENKNTLEVDVTNKASSNDKTATNQATVKTWGEYVQTIQLPADVDAAKMKVDRNGHDLVITLPKA